MSHPPLPDAEQPDVVELNPVFARPGEATALPRDRLPAGQALPETAYQIVHDEAMLDGNARLNLATFVGTWMDSHASRLYLEAADKNMIDRDEYPQTARIETRCLQMLAELWHAPDPGATVGTSTTGSSEACMLAGLALKRRWVHDRRTAGKDASRPNLVMSAAVQVCWEKFCNYFDVEARLVPVDTDHRVLDGHDLARWVDEDTIGVVSVLGVTYTGQFEPVGAVCAALDAIAAAGGPDVPVHVDGASGAMVAPFLSPDLPWDFRLERVASINTSGHKYGLVYPGVGWVVWRDAEALPRDLVFSVSYLGGAQETFALNFSRPGAQVLLQYYMFLRLGFEGYTRVQSTTRDVARYLAEGIAAIPAFELWNPPEDMPVFAWHLRPGHTETWNLHHLSERLRMRGWLVPAYPMPRNLTALTVQRIVVRNGLSHDLAESLLGDIRDQVAHLEALSDPAPPADQGPGFHH